MVSVRKALPLIAALGAAAALLTISHPARADDNIFPPAQAAKSAIDFDGKGFLIGGKRTFIASGGLEYARIPHELWRDRLLRIKRAGLNCVEIYTFWNWHEPQEGVFNFSGDHDLDAFLKLAKQLNLYVIARVGPYYCAEWDNGGYPNWLRFKPGVKVRTDDPQFLKYVDQYFDQLIPIIAQNQISRGGSVILVQLENEHPAGWGTAMNPYFAHLRDKAVSLGLEVPYFFSGLHHGGAPGSGKPWDSVNRTSPWFTTEFWSVWYDKYGESDWDAHDFDMRTWDIISNGGNGYNYYMIHGGSNFGYTNDSEDAASYDYGAAIGQAGDLRPLYYYVKKDAYFARAFAEILENSTNATPAFQGCAGNPQVGVKARTSPSGTIVFLRNGTKQPRQTTLKDDKGNDLTGGTPLTLAPYQTLPVVLNAPVCPGVTLTSSLSPILNVVTQGKTTTIVTYGAVGSLARLNFTVPAATTLGDQWEGKYPSIPNAIKLSGSKLSLSAVIRDCSGVSGAYGFRTGTETVRVLTVSDDIANRTWFAGDDANPEIVTGPAYLGEYSVPLPHQGGRLGVLGEEPGLGNARPDVQIWGDDDYFTGAYLTKPIPLPPPVAAPALSPWKSLNPNQYEPNLDDSGWLNCGDQPLQISADGNDSAYAWYRTKVAARIPGTYQILMPKPADWVQVFVDGKPAGAPNTAPSCEITAGTHTLAFFTEHFGHTKFYSYTGTLDAIDTKGLTRAVGVARGADAPMDLTTWRFLPVERRGKTPPDAAAPGWGPAKLGADAFNNKPGFAWFETTLPETVPSGAVLHFDNVDDNATVFVNGKNIGGHQGWGQPFDLTLDPSLLVNGTNKLDVLVENVDGAGGIYGSVSIASYQGSLPLSDWKLRGGPGDPFAADANWTPVGTGDAGEPRFFRSSFVADPPGEIGPHPIYRVTTTGLSHGSVWLNGHNLGRYPEKINVNGLYLPEPWLKAGGNDLVIFDDLGNSPSQVQIVVEQAASRTAIDYLSPPAKVGF